LRLLTWKNMIEGEEIPDRKFIVFRNPSDNNSPYGDGIGRALYWPIWFKKNGVKFWAVFLDKFGQPTPWGKYPPGTKPDDQDKLLDSLKAMQTDQAIVTPDNIAVEFLEAARTSSVDSYDRWEKFWNDAITFIILGQTASTEGTPGKLGSEEARTDIREEIVKADADLLSECQNDFLIPWLCNYNFPGLKKYPKVWVKTEPPEDLEKLSKVHQVVLPWLDDVPKSFIHETYSIPVPEAGEEVLVIEKPAPVPIGFAENQTRRYGDGQEKIDDIVSRTLKEGGIEQFRSSLEKIINEAQSLEDLRAKILDRFKDVDIGKMKEILSRAILIADLTGRLNVV